MPQLLCKLPTLGAGFRQRIADVGCEDGRRITKAIEVEVGHEEKPRRQGRASAAGSVSRPWPGGAATIQMRRFRPFVIGQ